MRIISLKNRMTYNKSILDMYASRDHGTSYGTDLYNLVILYDL